MPRQQWQAAGAADQPAPPDLGFAEGASQKQRHSGFHIDIVSLSGGA